jgi:phage FluMu protein Com
MVELRRVCRCGNKLLDKAEYSAIAFTIAGSELFVSGSRASWFPLNCPFCGSMGFIITATEETIRRSYGA